ncbi:SufD family Fe-S cluster assembly protein [Thiomicrorhabdus sp.]|uniref:SufD family Fe-S cluster assembly protein n=1 Tax=Thiomicrorhabdus sp. TaxID=2039724 RepID=UPI0029C77815|nr:SufD family Fe-S cluster assembly protein [Thiomicrorhabdus sp.]
MKTPDTYPISANEEELLSEVGYQPDNQRAGTSVIVDHDVKYSQTNTELVEVMPLQQALEKYDWVQDLVFGLIDPEENDHIRQAAETVHDPVGHFIWVKEGADVKLPIQKFSLLEVPQRRQFNHDITVIEKGAKVEIIAGSAVPKTVRAGHHISISETYIHEEAECRFITIEHWGEGMEVNGYSRTKMEKNARCTSKKVMINPIKQHYSQSKSYLQEGASSRDESIIFSPMNSHYEMESECYLQGKGAESESLARMVSAGGNIVNKALLIGESAESKGFIGCDGLKLSDNGEILSIPGLLAKDAKAQLSHEASIGMVSAEKIAYLMATGMNEDAARSLLIQGFLNLKEEHMPNSVRDSVTRMVDIAKSGAM